jgi:hypothetical protein
MEDCDENDDDREGDNCGEHDPAVDIVGTPGSGPSRVIVVVTVRHGWRGEERREQRDFNERNWNCNRIR